MIFRSILKRAITRLRLDRHGCARDVERVTSIVQRAADEEIRMSVVFAVSQRLLRVRHADEPRMSKELKRITHNPDTTQKCGLAGSI